MKTRLLIAFIFANLLGLSGYVFAQSPEPAPPTIQVSPIRFDWDFLTGEERTGIVNLKNYTNKPYEVKIQIEDFTVTQDSSQALFYIPDEKDPNKAYDVINWISFPVKEVVLAPGESRDYYFKVNVPKETPTGGYYGGLFFLYSPKIDSNSSEEDKAAVLVNTRIGVLLTMGIKGKEEIRRSGDLVDFYPDRKLFLEPPASFRAIVTNSGNIHYKAGGKITIKRFGQVIQELELDSKIVYPKKERSYETAWDFGAWDIGPYTADLELISEDGQIRIVGTTTFWAVPWKTIAAILGVILFLYVLYKLVLLKGKRDAMKAIKEQEKKMKSEE